ncbi:MAG: type II secretion system F family protein [Pirellulaceae bacterium]
MTSSSTPALSNDELVAFCEEVSAIARAGVPLESGLVALAKDLPGRLGKFSGEVGLRLQKGEPLSQILEMPESKISPIFRAVVLAGVRSGRLPVALEGMTFTLRHARRLRRLTSLALVYPLLVVGLAYLLFVLLAALYWVDVAPAYESMQFEPNAPLAFLFAAGDTVVFWAIWPPIGVALLLGVVWFRSRWAVWPRGGVARSRRPTPRRLLQLGRLAAFAETLSVLIHAGAPLQESLALAGDATGDARLAADARDVAAKIERGESPEALVRSGSAIPPRLLWRIAAGAGRGDLAELLQVAAAQLRDEAEQTYTTLTATIPLLLMIAIGGTATLLYALVVLVPWLLTLTDLSRMA